MFLLGAATSSFLTEYFAEKAILLIVGSLAIVIIFLELEGFQQKLLAKKEIAITLIM